MNEIVFTLRISAARFQMYYRGDADTVYAVGEDGRSVRFPARLLRPFVRHSGVMGRFRLCYDGNGRCLSLERLPDSD